jgi:aspartate/methionine/tyrosine aminotransferase
MGFISNRTATLGTENAFVVLKEVEDLAATGKDIVSFCIGQPDFVTPDNIRIRAIEAVVEGKTGYTPSPGIPELRRAVAETFSRTRGIEVDPDTVVIANGAKPFIGFSILTVTDYGEGHEVLYPNPGFPIYEAQIEGHGTVPVPLPLLERKKFNFDMDDLRRKVNEKSRLLILNSPQNPTGGVLSRAELEEIAEIVLPYENLWVYSDEVYSKMVYEDEFQSIASVPGMQERTIIVDGVSKSYAMTGWRMGWASNPTLARHFSRWMTNTESCGNQIAQWAAVEALSGPQNASDRMMAIFKERRDIIVEGLNAIEGIHCLTPGGAFYVWPNVTEVCAIIGAEDSEDLRKRLLYDAGVAVLADIHFGPRVEGEGQHIRLSYATSNDNIREGLKRIEAYIRENRR